MSAMVNTVYELTAHWDYALLLFLRVSGMLISSPIFGRKSVPAPIKISFCVMLMWLFFVTVPIPSAAVYETLLGYVLLCVKELLFGAAMGIVTSMFFNLAFSAGELIDMQIGFGIVSVYDIQNSSQVPMTGNLLNLVLLIVFFGENGHLKLIEILYSTVLRVPVGHVAISTDIATVAVEVFSLSFVLAVMVAMPVLAAGIIMEIVMGVLIRTVPQMNMFVVGIPVKIAVGLIVLMVSIPVFVAFSDTIFTSLFQSLERIFDTFGVAP